MYVIIGSNCDYFSRPKHLAWTIEYYIFRNYSWIKKLLLISSTKSTKITRQFNE